MKTRIYAAPAVKGLNSPRWIKRVIKILRTFTQSAISRFGPASPILSRLDKVNFIARHFSKKSPLFQSEIIAR